MSQLDKSVKAILRGVLMGILWGVLYSFLIFAISFLLFGAILDESAQSLYSRALIAGILGGIGFGSFFGGLTTAEHAPHSPLTHALVLGVVDGLLCMGSGMPSEVRQLQFIAVLCVALHGGWVGCRKRVAPSRVEQPPEKA